MKRYLLSALLILGFTALLAQDGQPCSSTPTVTDHEGNVYNTVQIGKQCWTRENMRATTSPTTRTYLVTNEPHEFTYSGKMARWYNNDSSKYDTRNLGLLYNWNAAMDTFNVKYGETSIDKSSSNAVILNDKDHRRGICPKGWHIPTDAEWGELELYTGICDSMEVFNDAEKWRGQKAAVLAGVGKWIVSEVVSSPGCVSKLNNMYGFSAFPAGYFREGVFGNLNYDAVFWTSTQHDNDEAYYRYLYFNQPTVARAEYSKYYGFSVRCIRD